MFLHVWKTASTKQKHFKKRADQTVPGHPDLSALTIINPPSRDHSAARRSKIKTILLPRSQTCFVLSHFQSTPCT